MLRLRKIKLDSDVILGFGPLYLPGIKNKIRAIAVGLSIESHVLGLEDMSPRS